VEGDDVVHLDRFAEEVSGGEFGLMYGRGGGIDEDNAAEFGANVSGLSIFKDVDDEADLAMRSVARLPCPAVGCGKTDKTRRYDGWALSSHGRQRRYER
jgi:hypothetical protein